LLLTLAVFGVMAILSGAGAGSSLSLSSQAPQHTSAVAAKRNHLAIFIVCVNLYLLEKSGGMQARAFFMPPP